MFNGTPAVFTVETSGKIKATVPSGATTGPISVTTPGGTATSAKDFRVVPQVFSFVPSSGAVGTSVTILGASFTGVTSVTFNGLAAAFSVDSNTQITAIVPINATSGPISVTGPGGTATSSSNFTVAPRITSFNPASGPVGTNVTLLGANFAGTSMVRFNGIPATFTVNSTTKIKASVPVGASSGLIDVTTPAGTAASAGIFTVTP